MSASRSLRVNAIANVIGVGKRGMSKFDLFLLMRALDYGFGSPFWERASKLFVSLPICPDHFVHLNVLLALDCGFQFAAVILLDSQLAPLLPFALRHYSRSYSLHRPRDRPHMQCGEEPAGLEAFS